MRRQLLGLLAACVLVFAGFLLGTAAVVVLHADDGPPYNTNPSWCRNHTPLNPLWWWPYQCMYPDDPQYGMAD